MKELEKIAREMAAEICRKINNKNLSKIETVLYPKQALLELLIMELKKSV